MEALRDRTVKIDVPYVTRLSDEIKIYEKDYNSVKVKGKHIAPHTIEMAAMWAVLTRLEEPKHAATREEHEPRRARKGVTNQENGQPGDLWTEPSGG
jgi:predicted Ser/Thr protein kinase